MSTWQHWLSPRPTKRSHIAREAVVKGPDGSILYEFLKLEKDGELVDVAQETHFIAHEDSEHFEVLSGTLGLVLNGQQIALTKEGGRVSIPAGARHTFWVHESTTEDVKMQVWVKPQNLKNGLDESFLRNVAGYRADCEKYKLQPSVFQLLIFLWDADIVLTPSFWMPQIILKGLHQLLAVYIGQYILGYKAAYPEYHDIHNKTN